MTFLSRWSGEILSILRIVAAYMFMLHGTQKIFGFPIEPYAPYELMSLNPGLAGLLETILGPLLLVGLFTRPVAFVLSGLAAIAYFMVHAPQSFWPTANGGEGAILYCFLFLYFAAVGGGRWSLDALRQRTSLST
jgi:putative oxidoreductase